MQALTANDLLTELVVELALEQAWLDSRAGDPIRRHEEGGKDDEHWHLGRCRTGEEALSRALAKSRSPRVPQSYFELVKRHPLTTIRNESA
jgi:hypothetical protein